LGKEIGLGRAGDLLDRKDISKQLSAIERGAANYSSEVRGLVLAITGAPGAGKSCLIDKLLFEWSSNGEKVAVLAVDPTSPKSGGALLGDRVRMDSLHHPEHGENLLVRSVATRGSSSSIPNRVGSMASFLYSKGFDKVIIETVGAGQNEIRCAAVADMIVLVEGPQSGDGVQAEKAGLLELADLVVVNKSDLEGAHRVAEEIRMSMNLNPNPAPVLLASALTGDGIDELVVQIDSLEISSHNLEARWRERLLGLLESKILENPSFDSIIERLVQEEIRLEDALEELLYERK